MFKTLLLKLSTPEGLIAIGVAAYPFSLAGDILLFAALAWAWRKRRKSSFTADDKAVVAIETALIFPVLLMLFGLMVFVGFGVLAQNALQFGAQAAAAATVSNSGASPSGVFAANVATIPLLVGPSVACTPGTGSATCVGTGTFLFPFAGLFGAKKTMTLTASATAATSTPAPAPGGTQ